VPAETRVRGDLNGRAFRPAQPALLFASGVAVRVRDVNGTIGPAHEMVIRIPSAP